MYAEMHARSAFSFLEGGSLPEGLAVRAAELDIPALALLDRDSLSGAVRFHLAAKKLGIRAHIGAEVSVVEGGYFPLLAENRAGYRNLCRLLTKVKLRAGRKGEGKATWGDLAEHAEGLICLTGDENGPLARSLSKGQGRACLKKLVETFGKKGVYVELARHFDREEEARNQAALELSREFRVPLLAVNGVKYATPPEREIFDALTCVRHKIKIQDAGKLLSANSERHLKSGQEIARLFTDLPQATRGAADLSSRLDFTLSDLGYEFPRYPVPTGDSMGSFLRKRVDDGARQRYRPFTAKARRQIEHELAIIEKLGLAGYFLIVWDIVEFCRKEGILVQGRGSAANSAVCYSLGITAVDPVGMDLLFERFLSEERGEWPDIDIDLPSGDQRERAIQYVYKRYGKLGAAMTANVITYRGRSAARDLGKVLGFEEEELARLARLVPQWGWKDPQETARKQFAEAGFSIDDPLVKKFQELYVGIQDLPRHLGQHSGGMIICQGQLDSVVPLEPATMPGRVVVQWDKDDCASMGIVKVDLLGLGMMAVLEDSIDLIRTYYSEEVNLAHLPQDDPEVYRILQRADTIGLFQVESRAQMSSLPRLRPQNFYDLVVQVAIIRPGPIVGQMMHPYLRRRQGKEPVKCLHPSLETVLERTLGVPLFQEQLLRMAMIAADFTAGEAEELRRAFGFKRAEARMSDVEEKLRIGMIKKGITGETQDLIVQSITSFALYGFPESHAASFALIAYASAYLKCHYLAAFTAAMLNNQPMGFYSPLTLIKDAQRHGLHFKPVDVTRSLWLSTIEVHDQQRWVRLGLNYVRGLREEAASAIVTARERSPFRSINDLRRRVPALHSNELRRLSQVGALNNLEPKSNIAPHRRDALWEAELALRPAGPLFVLEEIGEVPSPLKQMSDTERLNADLHGTGVTIGKHPMAFHRQRMNALGVVKASHLRNVSNGTPVKIAGAVVCRQRPGTARGLLFLSLEDETGIANAVVMPDQFEKFKSKIVHSSYLLIKGIVQNIDDVVTVKALFLESLEAEEAKLMSHDFH